MKTCKECVHWSEKSVSDNDEVSYDSYSGRHYCWLLSSKEDKGFGVDCKNDAEAVAHGVGGAAICTGEYFGCVHHRQKDLGIYQSPVPQIKDSIGNVFDADMRISVKSPWIDILENNNPKE